MRQRDIIAELHELLLDEHCNGCDIATCGINAAERSGYILTAIEQFADSGASSGRFDLLYEKLGNKFHRDARAEASAMADTLTSADCVHCNAVVWEPDDVEYHCDSCGADDCRRATVVDARPGDRSRRGIHLLNPTEAELEAAQETAIRDGYSRIYRHTPVTWGGFEPGQLGRPEWSAEERRAQFRLIAGGVA